MITKLEIFNESKKEKKYKQSELTEEMFQEWLLDVRKEFEEDEEEDIHDSMNLIAIGICVLDDPKSKKKLKDGWKDRLWEFFEDDLAHQGRLLCDECGNPMEVYYTVHCFHCEKPEPKNNELNYFQCVYWLEKNEEDFDKDELWGYLMDNEIVYGNDTWCKLPSDKSDKNMRIFMKHFDTKKTKYFVSW
jgi:hypothetical protein